MCIYTRQKRKRKIAHFPKGCKLHFFRQEERREGVAWSKSTIFDEIAVARYFCGHLGFMTAKKKLDLYCNISA